MKNTIQLQNEFNYKVRNFSLVAQGELTGTFNVVEKHCFGYTIVSDEDGQYIIKL
jgi:hypothetical protein